MCLWHGRGVVCVVMCPQVCVAAMWGFERRDSKCVCNESCDAMFLYGLSTVHTDCLRSLGGTRIQSRTRCVLLPTDAL